MEIRAPHSPEYINKQVCSREQTASDTFPGSLVSSTHDLPEEPLENLSGWRPYVLINTHNYVYICISPLQFPSFRATCTVWTNPKTWSRRTAQSPRRLHLQPSKPSCPYTTTL